MKNDHQIIREATDLALEAYGVDYWSREGLLIGDAADAFGNWKLAITELEAEENEVA